MSKKRRIIKLITAGKYDEEIKCYDEAIKINPNFAKTYGQLIDRPNIGCPREQE
ncbi:MAG: hypothetical protein H5T45_06185 [Thermoplasmatales archaeon]|nr:hypothetical protein [Thermoplasmatales archaeon]